jgi:rRNA maturation endonuclease Nob1
MALQDDQYMQLACESCESIYNIEFSISDTSEEEPDFCPFCGEKIHENNEDYDDLDEDDDR